ncbi:MAG: hypothetical protein ACRC5T_11205 [Cetobacterium sp.]
MVQFNQNVMFDPQQDINDKRRRAFAEQLIAKSSTPFKNEQAGGMTVARSGLENLADIGTGILGQYQLNEADKETVDVTRKRQKLMGEALGQLKDNPQGAAQVLSQDPSMMDASLKLYGDALNRDRDDALKREYFAQQMQLQQMPTADMRNFEYYNNLPPEQQGAYSQFNSIGRTNSTPAPMQTANRMFELEQVARDPNRNQQERLDAATQYNLLGQAAKTYGYASGVEKDFGINAPTNIPQQPMQSGQAGAPESPLAENPQAVTVDQFNQVFSQPNMQQPTIQPVVGFGGAVADIAGQKKGAEETAKIEAQQQGDLNKKGKQATNTIDLVQEARDILPKATGSGIGALKEGGATFLGVGTEAGAADARLNVIAAGLTSNVPRMEGPQSDKDTEMYRKAAGDVGNKTIPINSRLAALDTIEDIQRKYLPQGSQLIQPSVTQPQVNQLELKKGLVKNPDGSFNYGF